MTPYYHGNPYTACLACTQHSHCKVGGQHTCSCSPLHLYSPLLACTHLYSPVLTRPHPSSPVLTCTHLYSLVLTCIHLYSPVLTCTHLYSPVLTFTHLYSRRGRSATRVAAGTEWSRSYSYLTLHGQKGVILDRLSPKHWREKKIVFHHLKITLFWATLLYCRWAQIKSYISYILRKSR